MRKQTISQLPKTKLSCPGGCGHRKCGRCKRVKSGAPRGGRLIFRHPHDFRAAKGQPKLLIDEFQCCGCGEIWAFIFCCVGTEPESREAKLPRSISSKEFETEKIATESEAQRGMTSREDADNWMSSWEQRPDGRYVHEEETLKRLVGNEGDRK